MKKKYESPEMEVIELDGFDVIVTSSFDEGEEIIGQPKIGDE